MSEVIKDLSVLSERFREINKYIVEQANPEEQQPQGGDAQLPPPPPPPGGDQGMGGEQMPTGDQGQSDMGAQDMGMGDDMAAGLTGDDTEIDVDSDPDVEVVDDGGDPEGDMGSEDMGGDVEELDITDLVDSQKSIEGQQQDIFNTITTQMDKMEDMLGQLNNVYQKITDLEHKFDKYRPKTAKEKLELRSLDSGPFNQKLSDFFIDKEEDLEASGKNEYVLTSDEVENYSDSEVEDSFVSPQQKAYSDFARNVR